jgi:UDP-glucose 4-epimerase
VKDVVWALRRLLERRDSFGEIFNIGSEEEICIYDLATRVKALLNSHSSIELIPYDQAYDEGFEDMPRRVPDISKVRALIGFEPRTRLDDIIGTVAAAARGIA